VLVLERLVKADPCHEEAAHLLMRVFVRQGRRPDALRVSNRLVQALQDQLGAEPSIQIIQLREAIAMDDMADDPMLFQSEDVAGLRATSRLSRRHGTRQLPTPGEPAIDSQSVRISGQTDRLAPSANSLPAPPTPLIGREQELETLGALIESPAIRLLTLTGPGGTGKTRLAVAAAAAVAPRIGAMLGFVDLSAIRDPVLIFPTIAHALGIQARDEHVATAVQEALLGARWLLVLDNFEQLVTGALQVSDLVAACPELRVIVTSREVLRLRWEHVFAVQPLAVPDATHVASIHAAAASPAVALFVERAQAADATFDLTVKNAGVVSDICVRLDGLPLAIELAAARIRTLTLEAIRTRLRTRLPMPVGGARDMPARQRTVRDTVAWSYDLLDEVERHLFRQLSVFSGGCTIELAENVCVGEFDVIEGVSSLVDKNLLRREDGPTPNPRFRMLETIREFGLAALDGDGEGNSHRQRHAGVFLAFAERGLDSSARLGMTHQTSLAELEPEHDNLRAALSYFMTSGQIEPGLRLGAALTPFWVMRGHLREASAWLDRFLALAGEPTLARARALQAAGRVAEYEGRYEHSGQRLAASLEVARALGDDLGAARALAATGDLAGHRGDYAQAETCRREALEIFRRLGDSAGVAESITVLAEIRASCGALHEAHALGNEAIDLRRRLGDDWGTAYALCFHGEVSRRLGDLNAARVLLEEALTLWRGVGTKVGMRAALLDLTLVALDAMDTGAAARTCRDVLDLCREFVDRSGTMARCLEVAAAVACAFGAGAHSARLLGAADALRDALGAPLPVHERLEYDHWASATLALLGARRFGALRQEGRMLSVEEAVRVAYSGSPEPWAGHTSNAGTHRLDGYSALPTL
jgi:predicted ATPase